MHIVCTPDITAANIVSAIQVRLNLALNKACCQCYNGASTMRGRCWRFCQYLDSVSLIQDNCCLLLYNGINALDNTTSLL